MAATGKGPLLPGPLPRNAEVSQSPYDALLRLDEPGPGVAALGAFNYGGQSMVAVNFYHYGNQAAETVARETPLWQAWIQERFPMPAEPTGSQ